MSATDALASDRKNQKIVLLLCCLAAVRVFVYSAAFPFFNNVDEQANFDLVVKYSRFHVPRSLEPYSPASAADIALYRSYAFMGQPTNLPPWKSSDADVHALLQQTDRWLVIKNYECSQPPLYYATAGLWRDIGSAAGMHGEWSLYWVRFLNVIFAVALVWLAYRTARSVFPENVFATLAVPALVACLPQSIFFAINNDMLCALTFGLAFFWLLRFVSVPAPSVSTGVALGLACAAAYLTKMTDLPLLIVAAGAVAIHARRTARHQQLRAAGPGLIGLFVSAAVPIGLWMAWCKSHYGDLTGTEIKTEHFGWVHKSFLEWWHHPIYNPAGFWTFLSTILATFWQGEFFWHGSLMTSGIIGSGYAIISLAALGYAAKHLKTSTADVVQTRALRISFACVVVAILFWAWLSTTYEFGNFVYPSRDLPYFLSGRLILGALIPFMLLFVHALDRALVESSSRIKFLILDGLLLFMLAVELLTNLPVFANPYNWFHL